MSKNSTAPIVQTVMFKPFLVSLEARGVSPDTALETVGFSIHQIETQEYAPVLTWYDFVEHGAEITGDRHFGYRVGRTTALTQLPNLTGIAVTAMSLGDQVNRMVLNAARITNLGRYTLTNDGFSVELRLERRFSPRRPPAQMDAFGFGFFEQVLRAAVGGALDGRQIVVEISAPHAIPTNAIAGCSPRQGRDTGPVYRFPASWLGFTMGQGNGATEPAIDVDFLRSVGQIIRSNLWQPALNADIVANFCGVSKRTLQMRLKQAGTTFRHELTTARLNDAERLLTTTSLSVDEVAHAVGYESTSSFIRTFRATNGRTPSSLRPTGRR